MTLQLDKSVPNYWQFAKTLDDRPISYYKLGPKKGQPRICKLCPNFVRVSARKQRLCPQHMREFNTASRNRTKAKRAARLAKAALGIDRPPRKQLNQCTIRATHPEYTGLFSHLPEFAQAIAHQELNLMLTKRPNPTKHQYAAMVGAASNLAKHGGRREWGNWIRSRQNKKTYWRNRLSQPNE